MFLHRSKSFRHRGVALATGLMILLMTVLALAAGRIEWGNKKVKPRSDNNSWNIDIKIFLPKAPDVPSVPTKFVFQQLVYYERAMVDGDKLTTRNVPIEGKQPIVESVDIGFLDPRSGKIENRTQFSFKIRRDHGFECGEYKVTVRDARNDSVIGQAVNLTLDGENEVIDRRSVVFTGEEGKKKKKAAAEAAASGDDAKAKDEKKSDEGKSDEAASKAADAEPKAKPESSKEESAAPADAEQIKQKPGGCGCRVAGQVAGSRSALGWFAVATSVLLGRRLRRREV
jgi:hypothetical protein